MEKERMSINLIDLFSGAGGLTEGFLQDTDFNILAHVEKDTSASQTLKLREAFHYLKNSNKIASYIEFLNKKKTIEDLFKLIPNNILSKIINEEISEKTLPNIFDKIDGLIKKNKIHGIIGGPPCQAYSTIGRARNGKKKGHDERIYLYEFYIKFLEKYQPDFFIFENVKGLLSFKDVNGKLLFPKIRTAFIECGYDIEYKIINSKDFDVPQSRERLIICGAKNNYSNLSKLFFSKLSEYKSPSHRTVFDAFQDLPLLKSGEENNTYRSTPSTYIHSYYRQLSNIPLTQNIARPNNERDLEIYRQVNLAKQNGKNLKYYEIDKTLRTHRHNDKFLDRFKSLSWNTQSHTIVAHIAKDGHHYIHPDINQNRSITVREAARLQGFPDDYYFLYSRTSAFTQIGNAVPPILSQKFSKVISEIYKID